MPAMDIVDELRSQIGDDAAVVLDLLEAAADEIERLRDGIDAIKVYGTDTLSGPPDGVLDDRQWQRDGVLELTRRAICLLDGQSWT